MQATDLPTKMPTIWATGADSDHVRTVPIVPQTGGNASFQTGFPNATFVPVGAGGSWPYGQDFNGLFMAITQWLRWHQAGGPIVYDATFQTAIGGYPMGAVVRSLSFGLIRWRSVADNNLDNPDTGTSANWVTDGGANIGDISGFGGAENVLPAGWLICGGQAVSRTTYALLYAKIGTLWGAGDGSTTFNVPDGRGRALFGNDSMGGTAAGRLTSVSLGITSAVGKSGGNEQLQSHAHGVYDPSHVHGVGDPGHSHSIYDPSHAHAVLFDDDLGGPSSSDPGFLNAAGNTPETNTDARLTGIATYGAGTGIYLGYSGTGISIYAAGGGTSQNLPPAFIANYKIFAGV
jgi:microcystin-dependent protein